MRAICLPGLIVCLAGGCAREGGSGPAERGGALGITTVANLVSTCCVVVGFVLGCIELEPHPGS